MAIKSFLIAGYGYVGSHLKKALRKRYGEAVIITLSRSQAGSNGPVTEIDRHITLDLDEPVEWTGGELPDNPDAIFYLVPPPRTGLEDTRLSHFLSAIRKLRPGKIIGISTTGVYGDCKGAWVNEAFPVHPQTDRARRRVDMEEQLLSWSRHSGTPCIILRVPGIYGPGKVPVERLVRALPVLKETESPWSNRVHVDDLVQACIHAYLYAGQTDIFNISDGNPSTMTDFFMQVADAFDIPRPPVVSREEAREKLSSGMISYLQESKKIDNQKMIQELKVVLRYPDLATGLAACRKDMEN